MSKVNQKARTAPWDPLEMKNELAKLGEDVTRLFETHTDLVNVCGSGAIVGNVARLQRAIRDREGHQATLRQLWRDVERFQGEATRAMNELVRRLPVDMTTRQTIFSRIPVADMANPDPAPQRGESLIPIEQQRRILASRAEAQLRGFRQAVQQYEAQRDRVRGKIRWCLLIEQGRTDDEIAKLEAADAAEVPRAPSAPLPELEVETIRAEASE